MIKKYLSTGDFLKDYDSNPESFNMLIPIQTIQELSSLHRLVINLVFTSTNMMEKEIYQEKNARDEDGNKYPFPVYAHTNRGLQLISGAACGQDVGSKKILPPSCVKCTEVCKASRIPPVCSKCEYKDYSACEFTMRYPDMTGGWRLITKSKVVGQKAIDKNFASEKAESGAQDRCIRKALNIRQFYTMEELQKPFVVAYPVLDARDPDAKKALIAASIMSSNLLYGSGLQLGAGALPGAQAALPEGRNVDMSTGEIIDAGYETGCETGYEAGEPEPEEAVKPEETAKPWEKPEEKYYCSNPACKAEIAKTVYDASVAKFGAAACTKCQTAVKKGAAAK